jgi:DNA ligase (NAD+)
MSAFTTFKSQGIRALASMTQGQLESMITESNHAYHNGSSPLLSDAQYDVLIDYVRDKHPDSSVLSAVGAPVEATDRMKVRLPFYMGSMNKIKPDTNALATWKAKYPGPYTVSVKLDGVSCLYCCNGTTGGKLYTRGDGTIGQDISHLIPYFLLPPFQHNTVIRGELIIPKAVFEQKYKAEFSNARNLVAGIVNSKDTYRNREKLADIHFVAYEVITCSEGEVRSIRQMDFLVAKEFKTVQHAEVHNISNEFLSQTLTAWRASSPYDCDGIIVTDGSRAYPRKEGNPDHSFAFKQVLDDQMAETTVVDVVWTASKAGYLKPTVQFSPIQIGGVTISKCTGFNGQYIESQKIGIGCRVMIIRSGDVIPIIKEVLEPAQEPKMPDVPYVWGDTHVDIMLENADQDPTVRIKQIAAFFEQIGVDGLREATARRLFHGGQDTIAKILRMTVADYLRIDGFKDKTAQKLYSGVQTQVAAATLPMIMTASNTFGRGFGLKKVQAIMEQYPTVLVERDPKKLTRVDGMAAKSSQEFVNRVPAFMEFIRETGLEGKLSV